MEKEGNKNEWEREQKGEGEGHIGHITRTCTYTERTTQLKGRKSLQNERNSRPKKGSNEGLARNNIGYS